LVVPDPAPIATEPPPLFRANGVIDWEYNLGVKQKENNKKKYQIVR
jgi:hypothetical protein